MKLVASIGEAHTYVEWYESFDNSILPMKFVIIDGELYCVNTSKDYKDILFNKIITIGDKDASSVISGLSELVSSENKYWDKVNVVAMLRYTLMLETLGVNVDDGTVSFTYSEGNGNKDLLVKSEDNVIADRDGVETEFIVDNELNHVIDVMDDINAPNYFYVYDHINKILTVNYNRCANTEGYSFREFNKDLWSFISATDAEKIVVDMRCNMGGSSRIFDDFRNQLVRHKTFNKPGKFIILVGNRTFSSGVASASIAKRLSNVTIIGEPTGGKPNSYGNPVKVELKNSGMNVQCSTRYFEFYPGYEHETLIPDVIIENKIDNYRSGNDPLYEYLVIHGDTL